MRLGADCSLLWFIILRRQGENPYVNFGVDKLLFVDNAKKALGKKIVKIYWKNWGDRLAERFPLDFETLLLSWSDFPKSAQRIQTSNPLSDHYMQTKERGKYGETAIRLRNPQIISWLEDWGEKEEKSRRQHEPEWCTIQRLNSRSTIT